MTTIRAGFIGLGNQGAPMARRIVDAGLPLTLWARRPASLEPYADTTATSAATPAELAAASDVVGICVVADDDVLDVVLRPDGVLAGMAPGGVIAIHSTIHPDSCRRLEEAAAARGVRLIDAPVSGGAPIAEKGELLVMVGGDPEALEIARPVFDTFGATILHLGPIGSGQVAKLLNNFVLTALIAVALDTYSFADGVGVDRDALAEVLAHGSGRSEAAAVVARMRFGVGPLVPVREILRKDVDLTLDLGRRADVEGPGDVLTELAERTLAALADAPVAANP